MRSILEVSSEQVQFFITGVKKIAEFLRHYNFVKKYGEGADRMCRELEAAGFQSPKYRVNAFMLQSTIRNRLSLEEKSLFEANHHGFANEKSMPEQKAQLLEIVINAVEDKTISPTIAGNVKEVLETFTFGQIFGCKEIKSALHYGDYRAGSTIEIMHQLNLIEPVKG